MLAALDAHPGRQLFTVDVKDIDQFPELEKRFGEWVPVLLDGDHEICHYFLDADRLTSALSAASVSARVQEANKLE
jgi:thioredoxin reductase (NADPH)